MQIGKPLRLYTIEPVVEPVPASLEHRQEDDETPQRLDAAPHDAAFERLDRP